MEARDLKKIPISHLAMIILDNKNDDYLRKFAEIELNNRIKHLEIQFDDLMQSELEVINKRGLDINNYLFSPNPNMQQLMELYFNEVYATKFKDSKILFSERHLCTDMNFMAKFFDKICDIEIANLSRRINSKYLESDKYTLMLFKKALENRQQYIKDGREKIYKGLEILEFNSALNYLADRGLLSLVSHYTDEDLNKIDKSNLKKIKYASLVMSQFLLLDYDIFQNLYGMKKVLEDSSKLSSQRRILLSQAKDGIDVDYEAENMQKAKQKLISSLK